MDNFITLNALGLFSLVILLIVYFQASNYLDSKNLMLKRLWLSAIAYTFAVQFLDILSRLLISIPSPSLQTISYLCSFLLFLSVTVMSCSIALFINYSIECSDKVYYKLQRVFHIIIAFSGVLTLLSIPFGFLFSINKFNNFSYGNLYPFSIFISYLPLFIVLIRDAFVSKNRSTKTLMITGILFPSYFLFLQITDISPIPVIFPSITTFILIMNSLLTINAMYVDYLTGLKNARGVDKYFVDLPNKLEHSLMVLFVDFNNFKKINDMYGHKEGDYALSAFSKILSRLFKSNDLIARIGGDEFLIVTQIDSFKDAENTIRRIEIELAKFNMNSTKSYDLSVSYGYSINPPEVKANKDKLLDEADRKMYEEKAKYSKSISKI